MPSKGIVALCPFLSLSVLLPVCEVSSFAPPGTPAKTCCFVSDPEQKANQSTGIPQTVSQNKPFSLYNLKLIIIGICDSDGKLTNTGSEMSKIYESSH
jgi:hypothetical protein